MLLYVASRGLDEKLQKKGENKMREATVELESILEYCKAILNAETEEEVLAIKAEIGNIYKAVGYTEEEVQTYLNNIDAIVVMVESGEATISESGELVRSEVPTQKITEVSGAGMNVTSSQANTLAGIGLGVVGATLVACLAMKKRLFKNKKNKKF